MRGGVSGSLAEKGRKSERWMEAKDRKNDRGSNESMKRIVSVRQMKNKVKGGRQFQEVT